MAITKIHAVKATIGKTVDYICNPDKTDEQILISSFGCSPETAARDFAFDLSQTSGQGPNLGYHLIQSFAPGEVSFNEAHEVGVQLADRLLGGRHSYIVCTHIDKGHVHNHIVYCAADNISHKKYQENRKGYYEIRHLSDELCKEHNLSIINPGQKRGLQYKEWKAQRDGVSWKTQLKKDIDEAIKSSKSYDDFLAVMREKKYEIQGEILGDPSAKYIKFRDEGRERFVRGCERSLGSKNYTKERIAERIEEQNKRRDAWKKRQRLNPDYANRKLIDTSLEKFAESPGLHRWAKLQNLKIAASTYSSASSLNELEKSISAKTAIIKDKKRDISNIEQSMKELGEVIHYAEQYKANRKYQYHYEKSIDPERYMQNHETELLLYLGAENMLKRFGLNPRGINLEKLRANYTAMEHERNDLRISYKSAEKELTSMQKKKTTLEQYLQQEQPSQQHQKQNHRE